MAPPTVLGNRRGEAQTGHERLPGALSKLALIQLGTADQQLVADCMEADLGLSLTMEMVNIMRRERGDILVSRNAVFSAHKRMQPVVTKIGLMKQGKKDPTTNWARARYRYVTQILIRIGVLTPVHLGVRPRAGAGRQHAVARGAAPAAREQ